MKIKATFFIHCTWIHKQGAILAISVDYRGEIQPNFISMNSHANYR
jgi:hypothetical protein